MGKIKPNFIPFSVLISVYYKENPEYFKEALYSIWESQSIKPLEIIIVKDGPLSNELENVINEFSQYTPTKCIELVENCGLGIALAKGLEACSYDIVARMDSDDIARSDRFEHVKFLIDHSEYDVIGSNIAEFSENITNVTSYRIVPENSKEILLFAKRRNPMNHMSVVFRKEAVLRAGNYIPFQGYEDYYLWIRMLQKGSKFYNIQDNLIFARVSNDILSRRHGKSFFHQELKLQKEFVKIGFINRFDYITNIVLRAIPRLFPLWGLRYVYNYLHK